MRRRIVAVGLAVVLAALGTAGVLIYVRQANARAVAGVQAVTVMVAQGQIPAGTTAAGAESAGLLMSERLPAASVPANAVSSITPDLSGLVTSSDIAPGQVLLRPMLVSAANATSGLAVPKGKVAVTIDLCVPAAVAGNLHPGSQVVVFDTVSSGSGSGSGGLNEGAACSGQHVESGAHARTKVLLPSVEVLSVGTAAAAASQPGTPNAQPSAAPVSADGVLLLTLAVSQSDAQQLIQLTETGLPYLALLK